MKWPGRATKHVRKCKCMFGCCRQLSTIGFGSLTASNKRFFAFRSITTHENHSRHFVFLLNEKSMTNFIFESEAENSHLTIAFYDEEINSNSMLTKSLCANERCVGRQESDLCRVRAKERKNCLVAFSTFDLGWRRCVAKPKKQLHDISSLHNFGEPRPKWHCKF